MEKTTGRQILVQYKGSLSKIVIPVVVESRKCPVTGTFEVLQTGFKYWMGLVKMFNLQI